MTLIKLDPNAEEIAREESKNLAHYTQLVQRFQPKPVAPSSVSDAPRNTIVAVRIRPRFGEEVNRGEPQAVFVRAGEAGVIDTHQLRRSIKGKLPTLHTSTFNADRVYNLDTPTDHIFEDVTKPLIPWVFNGGTATLFAHGQTGSGKTHTLKGLQYLVSEEIFKDCYPSNCRIVMSFVELAGQSTYDLLNSREPVPILEDSLGNTNLRNVLKVDVTSHQEMVEYLDKASLLRRVSATDKNNASSRSHAICHLQIINQKSHQAGDLYLVDLAGSEAARDSVVHGAQRLKETREINSSLSVLNTCIRSKADAESSSKNPRVPFRQSSLTRVLKHVFDPASGKACKMVMLGCVNPCLEDIGPSKNTLRYAETCRSLVVNRDALAYDPKVPSTWTNAQLKAWIVHNSGTPAVDANILAPLETGSQILELPIPEFEARCLQTPGVTHRRAGAIQSKLWSMHVDSKRPKSENSSGPKTFGARGSSSQEPNTVARSLNFKQRIRPGMAIEWDGQGFPLADPSENIAIILSDVTAVPHSTEDLFGAYVNEKQEHIAPRTRYLCALVTPSHTLANSGYDVQLWKQFVVNVNSMTREVILDYDEQARHYFPQV